MTKRFCDICTDEIKDEHIVLIFREIVLDGWGESGCDCPTEFCFNCSKKAVQMIEEKVSDPHRKTMKKLEKIMLGYE